jgi:hypothetical protein
LAGVPPGFESLYIYIYIYIYIYRERERERERLWDEKAPTVGTLAQYQQHGT